MRHKYATPAVILARAPLAEAGMLATLLTSEFGLIRARAEGALTRIKATPSLSRDLADIIERALAAY